MQDGLRVCFWAGKTCFPSLPSAKTDAGRGACVVLKRQETTWPRRADPR